MWKYILIIAIVLFVIREINLMNQSLYIAPDNNQIISDDKTILSTIVNAIKKLREFHAQTPKEVSDTADKIPDEIQIKETDLPLPLIEENQTEIKPKNGQMQETIFTQENEPLLTFSKPETESHKTETVTTNSKNLSKPEKVQMTPYPDRFKKAQERVNAILQEMKHQ